MAPTELIRAVNRETGGQCERLDSCNVVIEYTELGARTALLPTFGASMMPVAFSGDVVCASTRPPSDAEDPEVQSSVMDRARVLDAVWLEPVQTSPNVIASRWRPRYERGWRGRIDPGAQPEAGPATQPDAGDSSAPDGSGVERQAAEIGAGLPANATPVQRVEALLDRLDDDRPVEFCSSP